MHKGALNINKSCLVCLQLYVTDDDIAQTAASMSTAFAIMQYYGLQLAQPSLCSWFESHTWQQLLFSDPRIIVRFTTFVEIMVPMFSMQFFTSQVVATLENAETGDNLFSLVLMIFLCCVFSSLLPPMQGRKIIYVV